MFQISEKQLQGHYAKHQPSTVLGWALGVVWTLVVITCSALPEVWMGFVAIAFLLGLMVFGYMKFFNRHGYRMNDYDPLKPDAKLQRTEFNCREVLRFVVPYSAAYVALNLAQSAAPWLVVIPAAIATGLGMVWYFNSGAHHPTHYAAPPQLFGDAGDDSSAVGTGQVFEGPDAIVAFMHADELVPGIYQRLESELVAELVAHGAVEHEVKAALNEADAHGQVVRIREMRHRGSTDQWLTLTEEASQEYQDSVRATRGLANK
ncbi:hypothetical protein I6H52_04815 [Corynebacterium urealyticum]|uniref:Putative membrane protein n=1 Tax=Corynebacterium urealyticum (strain ATCC 43042 / DSM 7109) TaxID=504474 RepID=B1VGM3_CORU7|nr:hypothetical protein [Corynebacterium urealyticum]QQC41270.1 hypothetical protein I6H51_05880 [Corynebacterium urealyticum]QQE51653.1 hypothetical protein I6H52_04815 [Corynebacterium urealyticum]CAQ05330.1 putative membrane protein [Corynebacterium urealyticum DSM 7109]SNV87771.1 Uncharacterised protein [Corynebacterium urealyticum]